MTRLNYNKGRNIAHNPDTDAKEVTRIVRCLGTTAAGLALSERIEQSNCDRTIVEYGPHIAETRHSRGIPEDAMKLAVEAGARVVGALCDHHGGNPYEHYAPLMPSTERDAV